MPSGPVVMRDEQLQRLSAALFDQYAETLRAHVRKLFPLRCRALGDEDVRRLCARAVERGRQLGFTTERNLTLWTDLYFALGSLWEDAPGMRWLLELAEDRSRSEDGRMFLIYRRLPARCPGSGDAAEAP